MNEPQGADEELPKQPSRLSCALWVSAGMTLLLVAFLAQREFSGLSNLLIPAGAWMILRGLL